MKRSKSMVILTVVLACLGLVNRIQADAVSFRAPLPPDQALVDRLVISSHFRGDHLDIIKRSGEDQSSGSTGVSYRARTLLDNGFTTRAALTLKHYFQNHKPEAPLWADTLMLYIDLSRILNDLPVPFSSALDDRIPIGASARFAAYLMEKGDIVRAAKLVTRWEESSLEPTPLSVMTEAKLKAASNRLDESISILRNFRPLETSGATDLVYLMLGFTHLESQDPRKARQSFLAIPPNSPFAAEALYGLAWSLIRDMELTGAAVRLQELLDHYPFSPLSRQAALDLALIYRDLGLFNSASQILKMEVQRITEFREWLHSLTERDLRPGSDFSTILDDVVSGQSPPPEVLNRTPSFIKAWLFDIATDRLITRSTRLLNGAGQMKREIGKLVQKHRDALRLFEWETGWNIERTREMDSIKDSLQSAQGNLPSFQQNFAMSLEQSSLEHFATERVIDIVARISTIDRRLESTRSDVSKVRSFSKVIERIRDSSPATEEGKALNRIRENAYMGLIESREKLIDLRSEIKALEGRIWLLVKGEAINYESRAARRIANQTTDLERVADKTNRALHVLEDQGSRVKRAITAVETDIHRLESTISENLDNIRSRIFHRRIVEVLDLAGKKAKALDEAEALILYTAADIEIKRMDEMRKALQEVIP